MVMATSVAARVATITMSCPRTVAVPNPPSSPAVDASCVVHVVSRAYPSEWLRSRLVFVSWTLIVGIGGRSDGKLCVDCFALV